MTHKIKRDFTNKRIQFYSHIINGTLTHSITAKYLDMTLDAKFRWKEHIKKKHEFDVKLRKMYWLLCRRSDLSVHKLMLYKQGLKSVWSCAEQNNTEVIQIHSQCAPTDTVINEITAWDFLDSGCNEAGGLLTRLKRAEPSLSLLLGTPVGWVRSKLNAGIKRKWRM